jgi:hypothetical protein
MVESNRMIKEASNSDLVRNLKKAIEEINTLKSENSALKIQNQALLRENEKYKILYKDNLTELEKYYRKKPSHSKVENSSRNTFQHETSNITSSSSHDQK